MPGYIENEFRMEVAKQRVIMILTEHPRVFYPDRNGYVESRGKSELLLMPISDLADRIVRTVYDALMEDHTHGKGKSVASSNDEA